MLVLQKSFNQLVVFNRRKGFIQNDDDDEFALYCSAFFILCLNLIHYRHILSPIRIKTGPKYGVLFGSSFDLFKWYSFVV